MWYLTKKIQILTVTFLKVSFFGNKSFAPKITIQCIELFSGCSQSIPKHWFYHWNDSVWLWARTKQHFFFKFSIFWNFHQNKNCFISEISKFHWWVVCKFLITRCLAPCYPQNFGQICIYQRDGELIKFPEMDRFVWNIFSIH